jgi:hypothetical protein
MKYGFNQSERKLPLPFQPTPITLVVNIIFALQRPVEILFFYYRRDHSVEADV